MGSWLLRRHSLIPTARLAGVVELLAWWTAPLAALKAIKSVKVPPISRAMVRATAVNCTGTIWTSYGEDRAGHWHLSHAAAVAAGRAVGGVCPRRPAQPGAVLSTARLGDALPGRARVRLAGDQSEVPGRRAVHGMGGALPAG